MVYYCKRSAGIRIPLGANTHLVLEHRLQARVDSVYYRRPSTISLDWTYLFDNLCMRFYRNAR
jgi:hypothetical protein